MGLDTSGVEDVLESEQAEAEVVEVAVVGEARSEAETAAVDWKRLFASAVHIRTLAFGLVATADLIVESERNVV